MYDQNLGRINFWRNSDTQCAHSKRFCEKIVNAFEASVFTAELSYLYISCIRPKSSMQYILATIQHIMHPQEGAFVFACERDKSYNFQSTALYFGNMLYKNHISDVSTFGCNRTHNAPAVIVFLKSHCHYVLCSLLLTPHTMQHSSQ